MCSYHRQTHNMTLEVQSPSRTSCHSELSGSTDSAGINLSQTSAGTPNISHSTQWVILLKADRQNKCGFKAANSIAYVTAGEEPAATRAGQACHDSSAPLCCLSMPTDGENKRREGGHKKDNQWGRWGDAQTQREQHTNKCMLGETHQLNWTIVFPAEVSTPAAQVLRGRTVTKAHGHTGGLRNRHHISKTKQRNMPIFAFIPLIPQFIYPHPFLLCFFVGG